MQKHNKAPRQSSKLFGKSVQTGSALLLCLGLSACGGGGGGSDSASGPSADTTAPAVAMTSPSINSATTSATTPVSGTASDASGIVRITVNGVEATTEDAYANWTASIPTGSGLDLISVEAEDGAGNIQSEEYSIRVNRLASIFEAPSELAFDPDSSRLTISDYQGKKVFTTNTSSPSLNQLALEVGGNAAELNQPRRLSAQADTGLLIDQAVTDRAAFESLYALDITSGELSALLNLEAEGISRVIDLVLSPDQSTVYFLAELANSRSGGSIWAHTFSDNRTEQLSQTESHSDPDFGAPSNLSINDSGTQLYYLDNNALVNYNIANNSLRTVSARSNSLALQAPSDLLVSSALGRAWVSDREAKALIEIRLSDGRRSVLSNNQDDAGPLFEAPASLALLADAGALLVSDSVLGLVYAVKLNNGQREYFLSNRYGNGPLLKKPVDVSFDPNDGSLLVVDATLDALLSIDVNTGDRSFVSASYDQDGQATSLGPVIDAPVSIVHDTAAGIAWLADAGNASISEIDLNTGFRSALTLTYETGARVIQKPFGLTLDNTNQRLLVSGVFSDSVQALRLSDARVSMVGNKLLSNGTKIDKPIATAYSSDLNRTYAVDALLKGVIEWDLNTNNSKVLSKVFVGQGPNFSQPIDIQIDDDAGLAYVSDQGLNALFSVDLSTGERQIISSATQGTGPSFKALAGIALDSDNNRILAADSSARAVYTVDLSNGNRAILSR